MTQLESHSNRTSTLAAKLALCAMATCWLPACSSARTSRMPIDRLGTDRHDAAAAAHAQRRPAVGADPARHLGHAQGDRRPPVADGKPWPSRLRQQALRRTHGSSAGGAVAAVNDCTTHGGVAAWFSSNNLGWIGVDLGTHTVKLAQAVRTPTGSRLRHAAVIQRPGPWSGRGLAGARASRIRRWPEICAALECGGFRGRNAACLLPMNVCELRGLKVPQGDDHERRAMIASELADD